MPVSWHAGDDWTGEAQVKKHLFRAFAVFLGSTLLFASQLSAQQLATLVALSAQPVVVVWQPTEAVAVAWEVFCAHWNTFCYPASDDASIRPLDERWCLEWHHDEYFLFGHL